MERELSWAITPDLCPHTFEATASLATSRDAQNALLLVTRIASAFDTDPQKAWELWESAGEAVDHALKDPGATLQSPAEIICAIEKARIHFQADNSLALRYATLGAEAASQLTDPWRRAELGSLALAWVAAIRSFTATSAADLQSALENAIGAYRAASGTRLAITRQVAAIAMVQCREYELATQALEESVGLHREAGNRLLLARGLASLSRCIFHAGGDRLKVLELAAEAEILAEGDRPLVQMIRLNRSAALIDLGEFGKAMECLDDIGRCESAAISSKRSWLKGAIHFCLGEYKSAASRLVASLDHLRSNGPLDDAVMVAISLAASYLAGGQPGEGRKVAAWAKQNAEALGLSDLVAAASAAESGSALAAEQIRNLVA